MMKALEWQLFLQRQREQHAKVLFTATELANVAGCSDATIRVTLQRLVACGVLQRYASGSYGMPGAVTIEDLAPALDRAAYITGLYALHRHRIVTQNPTAVLCFTNRRHNRSRARATSLGRIEFVCITSAVYAPPDESVIAPPEQALCDFVYVCRRRDLRPDALVTFRRLDSLDAERLASIVGRYPGTVGSELARLIRDSGSPRHCEP